MKIILLLTIVFAQLSIFSQTKKEEIILLEQKIDSIYIIPPRIDIEVIEVMPEWDGNFVTIKARVQNNGYYLVNEFESLTSLGLNSPLKKIEQIAIPGAEYRITEPSSSWYVDPKGQAFACVEVSLADGIKDEVPENDKLCVAVSSERFMVYDPFPNPGTDLLNIRMILPDDGDVTILLYTSEGQMLLNNTYNGIEGFNQLEVNTSFYSAGNYKILVQYEGKEATFSWIKN